MPALHVTALVLGIVTIAGTGLALIRSDRWWIRAMDFPRSQLAALGGAALFLLAIHGLTAEWELALAVLVVAAIGYQIVRIFPYTPVARKQVQNADRAEPAISLLLANVLISNQNAPALLTQVHQWKPDLFVAVETDARWEVELAGLEPGYPWVLRRPLENSYGMLLYSRLELLEPRILYLIEDDVPSMHACVKLDETLVELHFVHPRPPAPQESERSTERDAELLVVARAVKDSPRPVIVAGDLNDVAWSRTTRLFQRISRLLDPRIGRGLYSTFHARYPFLRWPLDHVFHSDHFTLRRLQRLKGFGSDHYPIFIEVVLQPQRQGEQEAPPVRPEHEVEADKKIEEAREGDQ